MKNSRNGSTKVQNPRRMYGLASDGIMINIASEVQLYSIDTYYMHCYAISWFCCPHI